jgi:hypothetical protein
MERERTMADLRKQAIAVLPMKQEAHLKLSYSGGWYIPVKRIWGKKEKERYLFRLYNPEREEWFECGPKLAKDIVEEVASIVDQHKVNISKTESIGIDIIKNGDGRKVKVDVEGLPTFGKLARGWNSVKRMFGINGYGINTEPQGKDDGS